MTDKFVTLRDTESDQTFTHIPANHGNYETLCGISSDDDCYEVVAKTAKKINCGHCRATFEACKQYTAKDFK